MVDHSQMKLGRKAIKTDTRTLRMARYLTPELPPPPPSIDWSRGQSQWGMMLNDTLGDCTIAGVGHAVQVWNLNTATQPASVETISDSTLLSYYERWDGYNPGDPSSDQGGIELDVLKNWRKDGFAGHKLLAFADPSVTNLDEIRQSIALFGGVYIGVSLPLTAQSQDLWDVVDDGGDAAEAGSWGGHCVFVPAYDAGSFTCITWGAPKKMTLAFWQQYCDEAHTLLGADWLTEKGSPAGFNQAQLLEDLADLH
jgi:hypothetical protein